MRVNKTSYIMMNDVDLSITLEHTFFIHSSNGNMVEFLVLGLLPHHETFLDVWQGKAL